jgi:hypothetical protein
MVQTKLIDGTLDLEWSQSKDKAKKRCNSCTANTQKNFQNWNRWTGQTRVLKWTNAQDWAVSTFIIPKKDGSVCFISDFCQLNEWIIQSPYPIPKIQDMLHKLKGILYATSLDLNMGYYHIKLNPDAQKYCTIITQWGCLSYLCLPMGVSSSADIFQEPMTELMQGLNFVCCYIDDVLTISKLHF